MGNNQSETRDIVDDSVAAVGPIMIASSTTTALSGRYMVAYDSYA